MWFFVAGLLLALFVALAWLYLRGGLIRNRAQGALGDIPIGTATSAARINLAPAARVAKRVANLTRMAPGGRQWVRLAQAGVADVVQFRIEFRNSGFTAIPADEVLVAGALTGPGQRIPGSGVANVGNGPDIAITDAVMDELFGDGISMNEITGTPAELPGRMSLYVRYRVRVTGAAPAVAAAGPLPGP